MARSRFFTNATTHIIADVTGYYAPPGTGGLYFHPLATPVRLLETRTGFSGCIAPGTPLNGTGDPNSNPNLDFELQGRSPVAPPCNSIPASAQVLVGNATSVFPGGGGYLTIYPSGGTRPTVASSNYAGTDVINGPFAVKLGGDGKFKIYTFATTHLVVDILGYFSADATDANGAGLLFNPLPSPVRLLETRPDFPGFPLTGCTRTNAKIQGNLASATHTQSAGGFCGLPSTAQAVVGNVSVVNSEGAGFLTLFPGNLATAPLVATSNYPAPATFGYNRHYFVGLSPIDGTFKVLTQFTTDLILDASGYFGAVNNRPRRLCAVNRSPRSPPGCVGFVAGILPTLPPPFTLKNNFFRVAGFGFGLRITKWKATDSRQSKHSCTHQFQAAGIVASLQMRAIGSIRSARLNVHMFCLGGNPMKCLIVLKRALLIGAVLLSLPACLWAADPGTELPATSDYSDQKTGSVLVFPFYTSTATPSAQNTQITVVNHNTDSGVPLRFTFVGNDGSFAPANPLILAASQSITFLTSDVDPGFTGFIVVVAVNTSGFPHQFQFLVRPGQYQAGERPRGQLESGGDCRHFAARVQRRHGDAEL